MRQRARRQTLLAALIGITVGLAAIPLFPATHLPSLGWCAAALTYLLLRWRDIWPLTSEETRTQAQQQDDSWIIDDLILITTAIVSLLTVALVLSHQDELTLHESLSRTILGVLTVVLAWAVVHTVYTLKYARLYYTDNTRGINFNTDEPPSYSDFAYVAFGVGMAFQVSDTNLQSTALRRVALRHALLSFLFTTTILATAISLIAGLNA